MYVCFVELNEHHFKCPTLTWASYQIRKIAGCACAGNAGNVSPRRRFQRKPIVGDPGMHHGTCVTHVPWCMSGSLTCGDGENVPGIPGACAPAILRIWQEAHGLSVGADQQSRDKSLMLLPQEDIRIVNQLPITSPVSHRDLVSHIPWFMTIHNENETLWYTQVVRYYQISVFTWKFLLHQATLSRSYTWLVYWWVPFGLLRCVNYWISNKNKHFSSLNNVPHNTKNVVKWKGRIKNRTMQSPIKMLTIRTLQTELKLPSNL